MADKVNLIELEQIGGEEIDGVKRAISYNAFYAPNLKPIGHIYREVDGFYVFEFSPVPQGCWGGYVLKELGDKIIELNRDWQAVLESS